MNLLSGSYKKGEQLHHAYLIAGPIEYSKSVVLDFLRSIDIQIEGSPDMHIEHFQTLSVLDSRDLKEQASRKPISGQQFFILSFSFASGEAQNALLKLFEEPNQGTHFFILTPSRGTLLPTVRSRLIQLELGNEKVVSVLGSDFMQADNGKRLVLLKKIFDEKNKESLLALVSSLESMYATQSVSKSTQTIEGLFYARKYLQMKSASVKMIGEFLATTMPHRL